MTHSRIAEQPNARELLQMIGGSRCPCGHLLTRHRKPDLLFATAGACHDCACRGLLEPPEDDDESEMT